MTVVCVDVPGCEGGAILSTADRGTVIFFSMATSFSAAALGAEGLAADVTMLVGNGYVPGHAAYALELLRGNAGVRGLFEGDSTVTDHRASSTSTRRTVAKARSLAAQGRPADRHASPSSTPPSSVERATLRLAGLAGADPDGTPWVNRLPTRSAPTSASSTASRCRSGTRCCAARPTTSTTLAQKAVRRLGALPAARGPGRRRAPRGRPARQVGAGHTPHRRAPRASASG